MKTYAEILGDEKREKLISSYGTKFHRAFCKRLRETLKSFDRAFEGAKIKAYSRGDSFKISGFRMCGFDEPIDIYICVDDGLISSLYISIGSSTNLRNFFGKEVKGICQHEDILSKIISNGFSFLSSYDDLTHVLDYLFHNTVFFNEKSYGRLKKFLTANATEI